MDVSQMFAPYTSDWNVIEPQVSTEIRLKVTGLLFRPLIQGIESSAFQVFYINNFRQWWLSNFYTIISCLVQKNGRTLAIVSENKAHDIKGVRSGNTSQLFANL